MPPLIDIYMFCAGLGSLYIVASAALGFANAADAGGGDAGGDSGDMSGADSGGDGGDMSGADSGGDGGDMSGADSGGDGGDMSGADSGGDGGDMSGAEAHQLMRANQGQYGMQTRKKRVNVSILILKILSPSTITAFMAFFGLGGYLILHYFPFLGAITLVPAIISGVMGYQLMTAMVGAVAAKMHSSGSYSSEQIIGRIAEVTVPIPAKGMGELSYTFGSGRETAPARSYDGVKTFPTGSRVVVADYRDGIYFVDEFSTDSDEILQLQDR